MNIVEWHKADVVYLASVSEHDELRVHDASVSLWLSLICFPSSVPTPDTSHVSGQLGLLELYLCFLTQKKQEDSYHCFPPLVTGSNRKELLTLENPTSAFTELNHF